MEVVCPICNSNSIKKAGFDRQRKQRYKCNTCGKYFAQSTIVRDFEPLKLRCRKCGGALIKQGYSKNKKQRYRCKCCGYRQIENPRQPLRITTNGELKCPNCDSVNVFRRGFDNNKNRQRYECKDCKRTFTESSNFQHLTDKQKKLIVLYCVNLKVPIKQIAEELKVSEVTVRNVKNNYLKAILQKQIDSEKVTFKKVASKQLRFTKKQRVYIVEEMLNKGMRIVQVARNIGCTPATISRIKAWYKETHDSK